MLGMEKPNKFDAFVCIYTYIFIKLDIDGAQETLGYNLCQPSSGLIQGNLKAHHRREIK